MLFLSRPEEKSRLFFLVFLFVLAAFNLQAAEKIDINTAPLEELEKITGVGPVIGQRIIDARPFTSVNDLIRVSGIGEKTLQKIIAQGLACVSGEIQTETTTETAQEQELAVEENPQNIQGSYASGLVINEILPSPEGQDEKEEWIEIFNQNDFAIDLSFWQITDIVGQTKTYTFPANTIIKAKGFLVLDRPTTKITLNNSEDGLLFIQPNGSTTDSVNYTKTQKGQSYSRMENNWVWSTVLTPGENNMVSLPTTQPENKKEESKAQQLAAISQQIPKTHFSVFFIALGFAILSGVIIIFTKKKLI